VALRAEGGGAICVLGVGGAARRAAAAEEALGRGASAPALAALAAEPAREDWRRALLAHLVRGALEEAGRRVAGGAP
jgi:hypothetical protein